MSEILVRLKKESKREKLTSVSGFCITKEWTKVDDKDRDIESFLTYRNDLEIEDVKNISKNKGKSSSKKNDKKKLNSKAKDDKSDVEESN